MQSLGWIVLAAVMVAGSPGPVDGLKGNNAGLSVEVRYTYVSGIMSKQDVVSGKLWNESDVAFAENPAMTIEGIWATDGSTEYYQFGSPAERIKEMKRKKPIIIEGEQGKFTERTYVPRTEAIWDGKNLAGHLIDESPEQDSTINVWATGEVGYLAFGKSPFFWFANDPFPAALTKLLPDVKPRVITSVRLGKQLDVEIYHLPRGKGWASYEISYDSSIGFLPKYARLSILRSQKSIQVREMYLTRSEITRTGSFVPTEWYETSFTVKHLGVEESSYDDMTAIIPEGNVFVGHFKVHKIIEKPEAIAIRNMNNVRSLSAIGGEVRVAKGSALTFGKIKSVLGRKIDNAASRAILNVDSAEVWKYRSTRRSFWPWILTGLAVIVLAILGTRHRRGTTTLMSVGLAVFLSGCGHLGDPVVKLSGDFTKKTVLLDNLVDNYQTLDLYLKNAGNVNIQIFEIDGGCSCRKVDGSRFPLMLPPGKSVTIPVSIQNKKTSLPQAVNFVVHSNHGQLFVPTDYTFLSTFFLDPETPNYGSLSEDGSWDFDVTKRSIHHGDGEQPKTKLSVPDGFQAVLRSSHSGIVDAEKSFVFEDEVYRISLVNKDLGPHKAVLALLDEKGTVLSESKISWTRLPYLSSIPETIFWAIRLPRILAMSRRNHRIHPG